MTNRKMPVRASNINKAVPTRIEWNGEPVLTTAQLAEAYGTAEKNVRTNFSDNSERFREGVHYVKLTGSDLRRFKNRTGISGSVGRNARSVLLWTKRGAARHCKMLDSDRAWEAFDLLERAYFDGRRLADGTEEAIVRLAPVAKGAADIASAMGLRGNQISLFSQKVVRALPGGDAIVKLIEAIGLESETQEARLSPTEIGRRLGNLSAQKVNLLLEAAGLQVREERGGRPAWTLTDEGHRYGTYLDVNKSRSDGTPVQQIKWYESVIDVIEPRAREVA